MMTLDGVSMLNTEICIIDGCNKPRDKKQNRKICQMHRSRFSRYKSYELPEKEKLPDGIVKICNIHGNLTEGMAYKSNSYKWYQCLACKKLSNEKFKEKNPKRNTNELKSYYYIRGSKLKLCKKKYNKMLIEQNYVCAICKKPETIINGHINRVPKRLAIDHCHESNKIRGLLCHFCNTTIGKMNDSIEILESAINYIKKHKQL
jgi:hypothetical protein